MPLIPPLVHWFLALLSLVSAFLGHCEVVASPLLCFQALPPSPALIFLRVTCEDVTVYGVEEMEAATSSLDHLYRMPWVGN